MFSSTAKICFAFPFFLQYVLSLNVKNTGVKPVHFTYYTPLHWLRYFTLIDEHKVTKVNPLSLQPGNATKFEFEFIMLQFAPI